MITRSKIADLPVDERNEITEILAEARGKKFPTSRFQSNADEASFVFYVLLAGSVFGLFAYLVAFGNPFSELAERWELGANALVGPGLGALLCIPLGVYSLRRILANYRGNGWALTSFGFVHVVRERVGIIRFADITKVETRKLVVGKAKRSATAITLTTRDGTKMNTYAGALLAGLRERLSPETQVVNV